MRLGFTPVWTGLAVALAAVACGGVPEPDTEPATHDDFRAIQRQEARIEAALDRARDPARACDDRCQSAHGTCEAARVICRIAEDTADLDVRARCRRAEDACREATHAGGLPGARAPDAEPCRCEAVSAQRAASTAS